MGISNRFIKEAGEYQIAVTGKFDFSLLNEFRDAYESAPTDAKKYVIDMRAVDMIDSSALGMLLKMKRALNLADGELDIINCSTNVKKILMIAKFELMFSIQ
ncbi:MAG: STAS domain-containing protein [Gammaproteobacteria bacterium]|nr:STAS domain-containing protein [Gammaproteobacteria bacterium]